MPPIVLPSLVNEAYGDPALFVPFSHDRSAYLFDIGDISPLSARNLLKISRVFVSHTHMDHFIGFDSLLRIILGREKTLYLYGPEGFLENLEGKLAGYSWNLVNNYSSSLFLEASELTPFYLIKRRYSCRKQFRQVCEDVSLETSVPAVLYEDEAHRVKAVILDHGLPCLGFCLEESYHINIRKDMLRHLGLRAGPWLKRLKQAVYSGSDPGRLIRAPSDSGTGEEKTFRLGDLMNDLAVITRGKKISYIADAAYTPSNISKIRMLARNSDHLFIEAPFLEADLEHATRKKHLTARQAGEVAGLTNSGRFTLFHFSPRYEGSPEAFYKEAMDAYKKSLPHGAAGKDSPGNCAL